MLQIPFSGIKKIEEIVNSSNEYISLSQGALKAGGIPSEIKKYIQGKLETDATDYYKSCWGIMELREKIAIFLNKTYDTSLTSARILPTHGCIGGLSLLYLSLLEPGDEVIIPEPAYPAYATLCQASRSTPVFVSMLKDNHDGGMWALNVDAIKAATTSKTKIIIFSNPWNPLGIIVPEQTIRELIVWCESKGIYLVIDEAYRDYDFDGSLVPGVNFVEQSEWVISANSFSKNFAMSGWRIGYLVVPENIIGALAGMQDALLNCLNNTAQYAALYALDHHEHVDRFHTLLKANRDYTCEQLQPLVDRGVLSFEKPAGSFFLFAKTQFNDATELSMKLLNEAKVGVIPGAGFGPSGASFIRICYAREAFVLQKGLKRLVHYCLEH